MPYISKQQPGARTNHSKAKGPRRTPRAQSARPIANFVNGSLVYTVRLVYTISAAPPTNSANSSTHFKRTPKTLLEIWASYTPRTPPALGNEINEHKKLQLGPGPLPPPDHVSLGPGLEKGEPYQGVIVFCFFEGGRLCQNNCCKAPTHSGVCSAKHKSKCVSCV